MSIDSISSSKRNIEIQIGATLKQTYENNWIDQPNVAWFLEQTIIFSQLLNQMTTFFNEPLIIFAAYCCMHRMTTEMRNDAVDTYVLFSGCIAIGCACDRTWAWFLLFTWITLHKVGIDKHRLFHAPRDIIFFDKH